MNPKLYLFPTIVSQTEPFVKFSDYRTVEEEARLANAKLDAQQTYIEKVESRGFASLQYNFSREKNALLKTIEAQNKKISDLEWKNKQLEEERADLIEKTNKDYREFEQMIKLRDQIITEDVKAASIFQPSGKYHKEANLELSSSCVVEGIKWMDKKIQFLEDKVKNLRRLNENLIEGRNQAVDAFNELNVKYLEDGIGWNKKWEIAVEMAAIAENKISELEPQLEEAIKMRDLWWKRYMSLKDGLYTKIDEVKAFCDKFAKKEFDNMMKIQ